MVGVPGRSGGSNRKRSDEKLGRPTVGKDHPDHPSNIDRPMAEPVVQPPLVFPSLAGRKWVPSEPVRNLWESMGASGFHEYYTRADWDAALTQMMRLDQMIQTMCSGQILPANQGAEMRAIFNDLLILESSRRRLKLEVARHKDTAPPLAAVAPIDRARASGL